jgi:hypothetical protein
MPIQSKGLEIGDHGTLLVWHPQGWVAELRDSVENKWILVFVPPNDQAKQLPASEYVISWSVESGVTVSALHEEQNIYLKSGMRLRYQLKERIEKELVFNHSSHGSALFVDPEKIE